MIEHKILFTDVRNTDVNLSKAMTTVGMDYGELTLDNGEKLRLYGTPGQQRFDFMWKILSNGALGLIILIDNSQSDPMDDLDRYLKGFAELIENTACVVAVGRLETHPQPGIEQFAAHITVGGQPGGLKPIKGGLHRRAQRGAGCQQRQLRAVAPAHALHQA